MMIMVVDNDNNDDGRSFLNSRCVNSTMCVQLKSTKGRGERNEIQDGKRVSEEREV